MNCESPELSCATSWERIQYTAIWPFGMPIDEYNSRQRRRLRASPTLPAQRPVYAEMGPEQNLCPIDKASTGW